MGGATVKFSLSIRGMQGVTERNSLNSLFGVYSCFRPASGGFQKCLQGSDQCLFLYVDFPGL